MSSEQDGNVSLMDNSFSDTAETISSRKPPSEELNSETDRVLSSEDLEQLEPDLTLEECDGDEDGSVQQEFSSPEEIDAVALNGYENHFSEHDTICDEKLSVGNSTSLKVVNDIEEGGNSSDVALATLDSHGSPSRDEQKDTDDLSREESVASDRELAVDDASSFSATSFIGENPGSHSEKVGNVGDYELLKRDEPLTHNGFPTEEMAISNLNDNLSHNSSISLEASYTGENAHYLDDKSEREGYDEPDRDELINGGEASSKETPHEAVKSSISQLGEATADYRRNLLDVDLENAQSNSYFQETNVLENLSVYEHLPRRSSFFSSTKISDSLSATGINLPNEELPDDQKKSSEYRSASAANEHQIESAENYSARCSQLDDCHEVVAPFNGEKKAEAVGCGSDLGDVEKGDDDFTEYQDHKSGISLNQDYTDTDTVLPCLPASCSSLNSRCDYLSDYERAVEDDCYSILSLAYDSVLQGSVGSCQESVGRRQESVGSCHSVEHADNSGSSEPLEQMEIKPPGLRVRRPGAELEDRELMRSILEVEKAQNVAEMEVVHTHSGGLDYEEEVDSETSEVEVDSGVANDQMEQSFLHSDQSMQLRYPTTASAKSRPQTARRLQRSNARTNLLIPPSSAEEKLIENEESEVEKLLEVSFQQDLSSGSSSKVSPTSLLAASSERENRQQRTLIPAIKKPMLLTKPVIGARQRLKGSATLVKPKLLRKRISGWSVKAKPLVSVSLAVRNGSRASNATSSDSPTLSSTPAVKAMKLNNLAKVRMRINTCPGNTDGYIYVLLNLTLAKQRIVNRVKSINEYNYFILFNQGNVMSRFENQVELNFMLIL